MGARRDFAGKVVVITGAAGGLGRALAGRWAAAGSRLALVDQDAGGVVSLAAELRRQEVDCLGLGCDITDPDQVHAAMGQVTSRWGGVDLLINNAGITQRSAFAATGAAVFRRVMEVNFFGSLYCTQAALESLVQRRGVIVVISSVAGFAPLLGRSGYCASKHALHGLFDSLRAELAGSGVDVCLVCPSFVDTGIAHRALDGDGSLTEHPQSTTGPVASPREAAERIFAAATRRRRLLVMGWVGKTTHLLTKLWPALYQRLMVRSLAGELQR